MDAENYYQILGIGTDADDDVVKQAFREKAKNYHPDRNPGNPEAELRFKLIGTAYDALKDSARRESYNQYLAFNEGQEKSERRQWSRLFSIIALLLLGPSVVFATIYVLGGLSLLTGGTEFADTANSPRKVEPSRPESRPAPTAAVEPKTVSPIAAVKAETERRLLPLATPSAAPGEAARDTTVQPVAPKAAPQPAPAPTLTPAPTLAPIPLAPAPQAAARPTIPAPAPTPVAPPLDQSRVAPVTPPADEDAAAGSPNTALDPFEGPEPQAPQQTPPPAGGEGDARASARLLARLKEPDTTTSTPPNAQVAALPREERQRETFADCSGCPLMSTKAQQADPQDQAVSLAEITVAEWNACAREGVCAPFVRNAPPESPVLGMTRNSATVYAEWLSVRSGESYRAVMSPAPIRAPTGITPNQNCAPGNQGRVTGFEWLEDDRQRPNPCPPGAAANGEDRPAGFRVARKLRRQS